MKILLLSPPYEGGSASGGVFPPLGLAYIASVLREKKHKVKIIDFALGCVRKKADGQYWYGKNYREIRKELKKYRPDLIGLGCFFSIRFPYSLQVAKICKNLFPKIPIVIGGIHATVNPYLVLKHREIDYVVLGEGEETIIKLVKAIKKKRLLSQIDGLSYRRGQKIFLNPKKNFLKNVDALPLPARDLLDMEAYISDRTVRWNLNSKRHTSVFTSRGCVNNCTFCSMFHINGRFFRGRDPKKVVNEIEQLIKNYNIEEISFEDDNLTYDKKRVINMCREIIRRRLKFSWNTPNGISAKTLDQEVLSWMKKAGCIAVNIAIESGDPVILNKIIRKGLSLDKAKEVVKIAHKLGLVVNAYFVLGMPGETWETAQRSIDLACSLPLYDIGISYATPFKGTVLYDECLKNKYVPKNIEKIMLTKGFRLYGTPIIITPLLSFQDLLKIKHKFYLKFYFTKLIRRPADFVKYIIANKQLIFPIIDYLKGIIIGYANH